MPKHIQALADYLETEEPDLPPKVRQVLISSLLNKLSDKKIATGIVELLGLGFQAGTSTNRNNAEEIDLVRIWLLKNHPETEGILHRDLIGRGNHHQVKRLLLIGFRAGRQQQQENPTSSEKHYL